VISAWLNVGGSRHTVEPFVKQWLEKYPDKMESSFLIKRWLAADGDRKVVRKYIRPWLKKFPLDEENTSFLIKAWLNSNGEVDVVEDFVKQWLDKYQESFEASYIIKSWLHATKDAESIKQYAHNWLRIYKGDKNADFVIKRFCRFKDIPDDVLNDAIYWCKKYSDNTEVLYTLSYLSRNHVFNRLFADTWLTDILSQWIDYTNLRPPDIINLESIICNISKNKEFAQTGAYLELLKKWLLSGHSFQPFILEGRYTHLQRWWYFEKYGKLFIEEHIDISAHEEKVRKLLHWANHWTPENRKELRINLYNLKKNLPQYSYLWDIVMIENERNEE
jgi:hypothetical protein